MRELDLRHLRVVCTVAEAGSLSRAAARLGVSQPALTAQLQRIERHVGAELFVRGNDGVRPTELGRYVIASARVLLGDMERLSAGIAQRVRADTVDAVHLAGPPGPRIPLWAAQVSAALPGVDVRMDTCVDTAALVGRVEDGSLDFVQVESFLGFDVALGRGLHQRLLVHEPLFVALPEDHPLAAGDEVALRDLAGEEWVMLPLDASAEQLAFGRACAEAGFTPRIRHQVTDASTARTLVTCGAVSLATATSRTGAGLAVRPLAGSPLVQQIMVLWRGDGRRAGCAEQIFRCAALGYLELVDVNPYYRRWWDANPLAHAEIDAAVLAAVAPAAASATM